MLWVLQYQQAQANATARRAVRTRATSKHAEQRQQCALFANANAPNVIEIPIGVCRMASLSSLLPNSDAGSAKSVENERQPLM